MRHVTGTREEIEQQLQELAEGSEHLEHERLRAEACAALDLLRQGAGTVTAGHSVFVIDDGPSQDAPGDVQSSGS